MGKKDGLKAMSEMQQPQGKSSQDDQPASGNKKARSGNGNYDEEDDVAATLVLVYCCIMKTMGVVPKRAKNGYQNKFHEFSSALESFIPSVTSLEMPQMPIAEHCPIARTIGSA